MEIIKNKKIGKLTSILFLLSLTSAASAMELEFDCDECSLRPLATLSGGIAIASDVSASKDFSRGITHFDYDANDDTQTRGVFGGLVGAEFAFEEEWAWQFGISYYQTTPFGADGYLTQGVDAQSSDTHKYTYKIVSRQLLFENKFLLSWEDDFHPYVLVGIGSAFNDAKDYNINPGPASTPHYSDKTHGSFSYALGLGLDYDVLPNIRVGLGYRFNDLGKAGFDDGHQGDDISTPALVKDHLYAHEIMAQLTFITN